LSSGPGLERAFAAAAGELGHATTAWLFAREVALERGPAGVEELRDALGRAFPVLDSVARQLLGGVSAPPLDPGPIVELCRGAARVLFVGIEAAALDLVVPALEGSRIGLVQHGDVDWRRVLGNWGGRVEGTDLAGFQRWSGARSVLVTFSYGGTGEVLHVQPTWLRVHGPDVRAAFRALVAWDVLGGPMFLYPRWHAATPREDFSHVVPAHARAAAPP
jgi:hypothetical protein